MLISASDLMKRAGGGRLVPFYKAVALYWALGGGSSSAAGAAAKCAPVLCLLLGVLLRDHACAERRRYARRVSLGLALSALGDALLVWPQHLLAGMAAFGAAHVAYIAAFGARPRAPALALLCFGAAAGYVWCVVGAGEGALRVAARAYAALVAGMAWRGAARAGPQRAGALLFLLSDAILGCSLFATPLPYSQVLVMSTYYLGQLCIALSALEPHPAPVTSHT